MAGLPDFIQRKPHKTDVVVMLENDLLRELDKYRPKGISRQEIIRQIIKQTILGSKPSDRRRGKLRKQAKRAAAKGSNQHTKNRGLEEKNSSENNDG